MNENNLTNKLDRIDTAIADMRRRIVLDENASIEEIAAATDLKSCTNIFIQEEEPEIKEGIWFQADAESHPYDTIAVDNETIVPYKWQLNNKKAMAVYAQGSPYGVYQNYFLKIDSNGYLRIYDMDNNMASVKTLSSNSYALKGTVFLIVVENKAYVTHSGCNGNMSVFNLDTLRYEGDKSLQAYTITYFTYNEITKCFYYGAGNTNYKYSLETQSYTKLPTTNLQSNQNFAVAIGPYVWYSRDNSHGVIRDVTDNNYPLVSAPASLQGKYFNGNEMKGSIATLDIDGYIYCISTNKSFKINKETLEAEWVTDLFKDDAVENFYGGAMYNGDLYGFVGSSMSEAYFTQMSFTSKEYPDNCVILVQSPLRNTLIQTQLWTYLKRNPFSGRILYSLYDAYYYNKELGLTRDMPTYYGDGEKWIKFKN